MGIFSSSPNTQKKTYSGDYDLFSFGASCMSGWRSKMEDAVCIGPNITPNVSVFGVFDGHGGVEIAQYCEKNFIPELLKNASFKQGQYKKSLEETFLKLDEILLAISENSASAEQKNLSRIAQRSGATGIIGLITPTDIFIANAGDSKSFLCFKDKTVKQMTIEHKPLLENEKKRITTAGGKISEGRINDVLNVSRSIGDLQFKINKDKPLIEQIVIALPEVRNEIINTNLDFLIIGCDGIYESLTIENMRDHLSTRLNSNQPMGKAIEDLLDRLVAKDTIEGLGCDNMSCIVIKFNKNKLK